MVVPRRAYHGRLGREASGLGCSVHSGGARLCRSDLSGSLQCCRELVLMSASLMSRLSPHRLIGLFNEWDDDGSTITC